MNRQELHKCECDYSGTSERQKRGETIARTGLDQRRETKVEKKNNRRRKLFGIKVQLTAVYTNH